MYIFLILLSSLVLSGCTGSTMDLMPLSSKNHNISRLKNKETYVEYSHGKGFSDSRCLIGSGRGCHYCDRRDMVYLVDRQECKWKTCGKAIFINGNFGMDLIDFDNKKYKFFYFYPKLSFNCQYYRIGDISYQVFEKKSNRNLINLFDYAHSKDNFYYFVDNILTKRTNKEIDKYLIYNKKRRSRLNYKLLKNSGFQEDTALDIGTLDKSSLIEDFINKYNLNRLLSSFSRKNWTPANGNTSEGLNGRGKLSFKNKEYEIEISGNFKDATLVENGELFIRKWFTDGGIHLFGQSVIKKVSVTSENLKSSIYKTYDDLDGQIDDYIAKKAMESKKMSNDISNYNINKNDESSTKNPSIKSYKCNYKCDGGFIKAGFVVVNATSNHMAQIKSAKKANEVCKKSGSKEGVLSQWWIGSTDCRLLR